MYKRVKWYLEVEEEEACPCPDDDDDFGISGNTKAVLSPVSLLLSPFELADDDPPIPNKPNDDGEVGFLAPTGEGEGEGKSRSMYGA